MSIYYTDDRVTLHHGAALDVLSTLPAGSVDCIVTSPPYFGLRDYGVDGQLGVEASPAEFVEALTLTLCEARRVLADDGTLWLNLGDSYYSGKGNPTGIDAKNPARRGHARTLDKPGADWARPKNLLGIPWRVAFALQDDGWNLRNDIIWAKPNAMPESVSDRLANRHEHLFMLTKSRRYWFDLDAVREPHAASTVSAAARKRIPYAAPGQRANLKTRGMNERGKNPGDVWNITTKPFRDAHFAVFPPELPDRCIRAGCKPGGTVLDPFSGSGTTGMAALALGRKYVGIELNAEYLDISLRTRLRQDALPVEATP
jgi:DNA modification methylase